MKRRSRLYFERKRITKAWEAEPVCWLCVCGNFEESEFHCSDCGHEPPWGCPCEMCQSAGWEDEEEYYDGWEIDRDEFFSSENERRPGLSAGEMNSFVNDDFPF